MKNTILALFIFLFSCLPAFSADLIEVNENSSSVPYVAVFSQTSFRSEWKNLKPNLLYLTNDWQDLDNFVEMVNDQAAGRPIVIDIDCHGNKYGFLCFTDKGKKHRASVGYVLNKLDNVTNIKYVTLEACFAGYCYKETCHDESYVIHNKKDQIEPYHSGEEPKYPIYGVCNISNYGNSIFLQKLMEKSIDIHDLRSYHYYDPGDPLDNSPLEDGIYYFFICCQMVAERLTELNN